MANKRILVVEDEDGVATLVQRHLERCGYQMAARVASGEEALRCIAQTDPALVLMDINLAGHLDGVQTAVRLRERFDLPVVFLSGLADEQTLQRSREAKAFGYVVKPFRWEDLRTSIDLALNKHQVESRLRQVERSFGAAIRSIGEGIIIADAQSRVTFLNPVAEKLTGWSLAEATVDQALDQVFRVTPPWAADPPSAQHGELKARDGTVLPIEYTAAGICNDAGAALGHVLVFRDITERRRMERELEISREQLRALVARVETLREQERTRIAREVHDELGQMITGLRMDLSWMEKRLPTVPDDTLRQALLGKSRSMFELLDHLVRAVRRISWDLRPVVLDDLGLPSAMEWQAGEWQARTGIACQVRILAAPPQLPDEVATALFRIFQEALTNVARHANATRVEVQLAHDNGWVTLEIRDNGQGITAEQQRQTRSCGLLGMKERVRLLGGACVLQGSPGQGTLVQVRIHSP